MRSAVKFLAVNLLVTFVALNVVVWSISLFYSLHRAFTTSEQTAILRKAGRMAKLPNYAGVDWARTHFQEFDALKTRYVSFIEWRREDFSGKTITVSGPYGQRRTVGTADASKPSVYFFGGSTMWGTGSDDANTIPSHFAQISGHPTQNFGESAYSAHQSLVLLLRLLEDGHRPNLVVFYDGVNDVLHKCRTELTPWSHAREGRIAGALKETSSGEYGLQYMIGPLFAAARGISGMIFRGARDPDKQYNCHRDPKKAQQIADNLLEDWTMARRLVEAHGGKFVGILQPVAYFSDTKLDRVRLKDIERKQYQVVYPLIKQKMAAHPALHDFTEVLNKPEYIYVDFCHVSPNGIRYVAQRIAQTLAN